MTVNINQVPHSIEAEQSVIGALLLDPQSENSQYVLSMLSPDSFYGQHHKLIYTEIRVLNNQHHAIDIITVDDSLKRVGKSDQAGGFSYLAEVAKNTPSTANIVAYAKKIKETAAERYAIEKTNEIHRLLMTPSTLTFAEKMDMAQRLMGEAAENGVTGKKTGLKPISEIADRFFEKLEERFNNPEHRGLKTGFPDFDDMLAPKYIVNGSLFVIGARPKMGKTTVLTEMAKNVAANGQSVLLFSMEMTDEQLFERMVSQKSGVNTDTLYGGTDDDYEWDLLCRAIGELRDTPNVWVDDTPAMTFAHIQSQCRKIKRRVGKIGFIGVDYLTLMKTEKAERNDIAYGNITKGLKILAKELDTVVVLLTQLNRNIEERGNKRPMPSDSRDTGQIEQDCDYWMGVYRDSVYHEKSDQTLTELILRLNRHGKAGTTYIEQKGLCLFPLDQVEGERRAKRNEDRPNKPHHKDF
ncbi:replicative DNA helicase [Xenorhabdus anantnagensis]|uniref:DNA 5'-3' helicase n=1 Tax=Xenorhabdus anantnagensis TaxID=3025875 RepID=A0ABT5M0X9_9GAMM|nr:DnaB-like helicase C-terminal domain-containing protein [Xenorhabdus anantnagensis]MDC9598969.1 DnaB-like helicase C-terminal domain-containing protein [Xenorhabdus anantnagensis]